MQRILFLGALILLATGSLVAQQYKVLYSFGNGAGDGVNPTGSLILDRIGNLYGTTKNGGSGKGCPSGCGTVFKLSPASDGTWTETILYTFCTNYGNERCLDGSTPQAGLVFDRSGNLYGTTTYGNGQACPGLSLGCGVVFKLNRPAIPQGAWTESVLYSFCSNDVNFQCLDGAFPYSQITIDAAGNLYGTTSTGGNGRANGGTVFELLPGTSGWTEKVIYNFCSVGQGNTCLDGTMPMAGVTFDRVGNLYGTTEAGGNFQGGGSVYKLVPSGNGWTEIVLKSSKQLLGANPMGTVSLDPLGNIYSSTSAAGQGGNGSIFRLSPNGGGTAFEFNGTDGARPTAGVTIAFGALYGTASVGGTNSSGTVFKIIAPANYTTLYNFCAQPSCQDGQYPLTSVSLDTSGNVYGTTELGGANNGGVVFEIISQNSHSQTAARGSSWRTIPPVGKN